MSKIRKVSVARRAYQMAVSMKSVQKKLRKIRHRREFPPTKFPKLMKMIRRENKRSGYDPATGTNWCHLPMEMRMMCVRRMNFKTSCCLRGTSTIEKALVESEKYDVRYLEIDWERFTMESYLERVEDQHVYRNTSKTPEEGRKLASMLKLVLKLCAFDIVRVRSCLILEPEDLLERIPFNCRYLELEDNNYPTLMFFLDSCTNHNEHIEFRSAIDLPLYQVINKPSVFTAKSVTFSALECACQLHHLFTYWMRTDAEIGTRLTIETYKPLVLQHLATLYGYGVLGNGEHSFRIYSLSNETKEVLVNGKTNLTYELVTCTVVAKTPLNAPEAV